MHITEYHLDLVIQALRAMLPLKQPADAVLRHFFQEERLGSRERALVRKPPSASCATVSFWSTPASPPLGARHPAPHGAGLLGAVWRLQPARTGAVAEKAMRANWLGTVKRHRAGRRCRCPSRPNCRNGLVEKLRGSMADADILATGPRHAATSAAGPARQYASGHARRGAASFRRKAWKRAPHPGRPSASASAGKPALNKHPLFLSGKVEVQDEGSQLLGFLLAPKRNDMVVDFCAGAGGKTLLLGAMMNSQGRLYAFDVSEKRLANLKLRLKRSGLSNLHPQLIAHENDHKIKRLAGKIDRVLVDAPCSGMGTLRRNPDLKFRQSPQSIEELTQKQAAILAAASKLLKPGGRLVYATCSLLPEENRAIVDAFLAAHPEFTLRPASEILAQQLIPLDTGECLQLSPLLHGTDGFFAAVMERKQAS